VGRRLRKPVTSTVATSVVVIFGIAQRIPEHREPPSLCEAPSQSMQAPHRPHDDETHTEADTDATTVAQPVQQAPPPVQPIPLGQQLFDAGWWLRDDAEWWYAAQRAAMDAMHRNAGRDGPA
jgi:hypothetical protein